MHKAQGNKTANSVHNLWNRVSNYFSRNLDEAQDLRQQIRTELRVTADDLNCVFAETFEAWLLAESAQELASHGDYSAHVHAHLENPQSYVPVEPQCETYAGQNFFDRNLNYTLYTPRGMRTAIEDFHAFAKAVPQAGLWDRYSGNARYHLEDYLREISDRAGDITRDMADIRRECEQNKQQSMKTYNREFTALGQYYTFLLAQYGQDGPEGVIEFIQGEGNPYLGELLALPRARSGLQESLLSELLRGAQSVEDEETILTDVLLAMGDFDQCDVALDTLANGLEPGERQARLAGYVRAFKTINEFETNDIPGQGGKANLSSQVGFLGYLLRHAVENPQDLIQEYRKQSSEHVELCPPRARAPVAAQDRLLSIPGLDL